MARTPCRAAGVARPRLGLRATKRLAERQCIPHPDRGGPIPCRCPGRLRGRAARRHPPADLGARRHHRVHDRRRHASASSRRLPRRATRSSDDVPQSDDEGGAVRGDRGRRAVLEAMSDNLGGHIDPTTPFGRRRPGRRARRRAHRLHRRRRRGELPPPACTRQGAGVLARRRRRRRGGRPRAARGRGRQRHRRHGPARAPPAREPAAPCRPVEDARPSTRPPPGLGAALLEAAEQTARDCGKTLLVLDTNTGSDAERLYARMGWIRVGTIPGYSVQPRGGLRATTLFYKTL